jgi:hypothetical protein
MDGASKIGLSIVAAAAIIVGTYVAYQEFSRKRDIDEASQALQAIKDVVAPVRTVELPDPEMVRLEAQAASAPDNSLRRDMALKPGEACFNGELLVRAPSGRVLHATHRDGSPVRCKGLERLP